MKIDYAAYKALKIARPAPRVIEISMSNPGKLNSLDRHGRAGDPHRLARRHCWQSCC